MKHFIPVALITVCTFTIAEPVNAQLPFSQSRSFSFNGRRGAVGAVSGQASFSPYLNLLRGGNSTLLNYYGLVRPEQEFRQANQQFQSSLGQVRADFQQQFMTDPNLQLPESGHQVQFQSDLRGPARFTSSRTSQFGSSSQAGSQSTYTMTPTGHGVAFGNSGNWFPAATAARPQVSPRR